MTTRGLGGRGLEGHLRLVCAADSEGRSFLADQSFSVPFHLSKPYLDRGVLIANVVNPTAGLLQGDVARSEIEVRPGARLLLTAPSATRIHDSLGGKSETRQRFTVHAGGWLEIQPELLIPQRGARHRQVTSIDVASSGELLYLEMLAPGRVASGEIFAFAELDWRTELHLDGRLVAREKFVLSPRNGSLHAIEKVFTHPYVATFFVITKYLQQSSACWDEINSLHSPDLWIGSSQLVAGGWVIKMIADSSSCLRQSVAAVREKIFRDAAWPLPNLRKL